MSEAISSSVSPRTKRRWTSSQGVLLVGLIRVAIAGEQVGLLRAVLGGEPSAEVLETLAPHLEASQTATDDSRPGW
jgi:hypothetical protein